MTLLVISPPLSLFLLYNSNCKQWLPDLGLETRCQEYRHLKGRSLLYRAWVNNRVLLYSTGIYMQCPVMSQNGGLPWRPSVSESTCQCRAHRFSPWSEKIPHAMGQLSRCATTTEAHAPRAYALRQEKPQ